MLCVPDAYQGPSHNLCREQICRHGPAGPPPAGGGHIQDQSPGKGIKSSTHTVNRAQNCLAANPVFKGILILYHWGYSNSCKCIQSVRFLLMYFVGYAVLYRVAIANPNNAY